MRREVPRRRYDVTLPLEVSEVIERLREKGFRVSTILESAVIEYVKKLREIEGVLEAMKRKEGVFAPKEKIKQFEKELVK